MLEKSFVDFGEAQESGGIGGQLFRHLNERPHHENAYFTASQLFKMLAAMIALCSVKA